MLMDIGNDILLMICMVFLCLVALLIAINCSRGIVKTVLSYFLVTIMLIVTVFLTVSKVMNHVAIESEKKIKVERLRQSQERERLESQALEAAKENEELRGQIDEKLDKAVVDIITDIERATIILRDIASINDARYNEIYFNNSVFQSYRTKSVNYYNRLRDLNSKYSKKDFPASLKSVEKDIKNGFKNAEQSALIFRRIFFDENDAMFPRHLSPAQNAIRSLGNAKRVMEQ